jgi:hypothetical protein
MGNHVEKRGSAVSQISEGVCCSYDMKLVEETTNCTVTQKFVIVQVNVQCKRKLKQQSKCAISTHKKIEGSYKDDTNI